MKAVVDSAATGADAFFHRKRSCCFKRMCQVDVSIVHRHFAKSVFDRFNFVIAYKRRNMLVSYSCCAFNLKFEPSGEGQYHFVGAYHRERAEGPYHFVGSHECNKLYLKSVVVVVLFFNAFNFLIVY